MYVSRQECLLHLFKLWFEVSLERVNQLRQIACICFHFPKQQGITAPCLGEVTHSQAGQDALVEGAFHILAASTRKRDPVIIALNIHRSLIPIHCYNVICVTIIQ